MLITILVDCGVHFSCVLQRLPQGEGQGIKMCFVLAGMGCCATRTESAKAKWHPAVENACL